MHIEKLTSTNLHAYLTYLKAAFADEPSMMTAEHICADEIIHRVEAQSAQQSNSLLAMENGEVLGRIEYHYYQCLQDGCRMAYVSWVYVARKYRRKGVARALFRAFEEECAANDIDEYFLIQAKNENAAKFYQAFTGANSTDERILRKALPQSN